MASFSYGNRRGGGNGGGDGEVSLSPILQTNADTTPSRRHLGELHEKEIGVIITQRIVVDAENEGGLITFVHSKRKSVNGKHLLLLLCWIFEMYLQGI